MTDRHALNLLTLLADYAEEYGNGLTLDLTVVQLADDLADSNDDPGLLIEVKDQRNRITDGLGQV